LFDLALQQTFIDLDNRESTRQILWLSTHLQLKVGCKVF